MSQEKVTFDKFSRFLNGCMSVLTQSVYLQGLDEGLGNVPEDDPIFNTSFTKIFSSYSHRIGFNETQVVTYSYFCRERVKTPIFSVQVSSSKCHEELLYGK